MPEKKNAVENTLKQMTSGISISIITGILGTLAYLVRSIVVPGLGVLCCMSNLLYGTVQEQLVLRIMERKNVPGGACCVDQRFSQR
jgi:hypothetical protein